MHPRTILARSTKRDSIVLLRDHASKVFLSSSEQRGIFALLDIGAPFVQEYINYRVLMQLSTSFWCETSPQGRLRKAQGASPGNKDSNNGSPEGAMQWVPVPKTCLMTSIYLELRPNSLRRPFRSFRNLDLEPRARALGCPA